MKTTEFGETQIICEILISFFYRQFEGKCIRYFIRNENVRKESVLYFFFFLSYDFFQRTPLSFFRIFRCSHSYEFRRNTIFRVNILLRKLAKTKDNYTTFFH